MLMLMGFSLLTFSARFYEHVFRLKAVDALLMMTIPNTMDYVNAYYKTIEIVYSTLCLF